MLTVEGGQYLRDGQPHQVISGAIHYFRIDPSLWRDRLLRLRALGLNTVETYVAWNLHERTRGQFDFTGPRDLAAFVTLAGELGLDVIVRPGPYICAEWDFGGLPAHLLTEPMDLRTSDPRYLAHVDRWLDAIVPVIAPLQATHGGPVVAVQVENEYGSFGSDKAYLEHVRAGLVARGIDVLLLTTDGGGADWQANGTLPGVLTTATFGSRVEESFGHLRAVQPEGPDTCMEYWHGWFDHWGEEHHTRDAAEAAAVLEEMLARGASVNLYMAHGGTNFGLWNGCNQADGKLQPTTTSYDYDAPVGEAGECGVKFEAFRAVITRHTGATPDAPPPLPARLQPAASGITAWAALLDHLDLFDEPVTSPHPAWQEDLGADHGLVHYRGSTWVPPEGRDLVLVDLHDRATVLVDGAYRATLDRNDGEVRLPLLPRPDATPLDIDLVVENQGRTNFGPAVGERKGLGGVRLGDRWIHGWSSRALRIDADGWTDGVRWAPDRPATQGPVLARTTVEVDAPADGFLALPGWGKGFVWLNGRLLGRYWEVGPQVTLYAPGAWWRAGTNEVVVCELLAPGDVVEVRDTPELG